MNPIITKKQQEYIVSLIEQNKAKFTHFIFRQFHDIGQSDIEDCMQELFLRTYEEFPSFEESSNQIGWLFNTLKNIMHEFCRAKKKHEDLISSEREISDMKDEGLWEDHAIFEILTKNISEEELVEAVLSKLNDKERKIYELRYIAGKSTKEIADELHLPSGTVRGRLSDIKKMIKNYVIDNKFFEDLKK